MSVKNQCPCRDCVNRHFLCHSRCAAYQDWKREYEAVTTANPPNHMLKTDYDHQPYWRKRMAKKGRFHRSCGDD